MNLKNKVGERRCYLCNAVKPATTEFFPRDKNRSLGLGYQCRPCALEAGRKREKPRPIRWAQMTVDQKAARKTIQQKYNASGGWGCMRVGAYKLYDARRGFKCDLTFEWFRDNIQNKACVYCRRDTVRMGCDRIFNTRGHTHDNVVPACGDCNKARQDIFTHEEMLLLGPHIAAIFARR